VENVGPPTFSIFPHHFPSFVRPLPIPLRNTGHEARVTPVLRAPQRTQRLCVVFSLLRARHSSLATRHCLSHTSHNPTASALSFLFSALATRHSPLATALHTSHNSTAAANDFNGSRVGTNSCATYPAYPVAAIPRITPAHSTSCVSSNSCRPGTPPV